MASTPRKTVTPKSVAPAVEAASTAIPAAPTGAAPAVAPAAAVEAPASVDVPVALEPIARVQEQVREQAEKGLEQLRANYATFRESAEKASGKIEESFTAASDGSRNLTQKAVELLRVNSLAVFAHAEALFGARSLAEAAQIQQEFARAQFETMQTQARELAELAQKVGTSVAEPIKQSFASTH